MNSNQLATVAVILFLNETIQSLTSFSENSEGNLEAENIFKSKIEQYYPNKYNDDDLNAFLDNGYFESDDETVKLYLVHSSTQTEFMEF